MGQVQTTRETESKTLNIASGGSVTSTAISLDNRKEMAAFNVHLPSGITGVLFPLICDTEDGTYEVVYKSDGTLNYLDTSGKILPSWQTLDTESLFPAHYIKFATMTSSAGTAGTAQAAAREIRVMGIS